MLRNTNLEIRRQIDENEGNRCKLKQPRGNSVVDLDRHRDDCECVAISAGERTLNEDKRRLLAVV